ncbi:hypothetical protein AA0229_2684 [Gluconobacter cerinus NRIC 0229]|nr:hypothetical protein AA0229_2684 [Gluconobacter cerinus NRIC 0229]
MQRHQAACKLQERTFARAVRPYNSNDFSGRERQIKIVNNLTTTRSG